METWYKIKILKLQGKSNRQIARILHISKNTVRKYLSSKEPPVFQKRDYQSILDKFLEEIENMRKKGYIGTRIFSELKNMGYEGSLATVHRVLRNIKTEEIQNKKATTRFETLPGEQMQYDWKEWTLIIAEKTQKIYIHKLILGYSRKKFYTFSLTIKTIDIIRAIYEGINFFGGIAPELIIDNPKQMVIYHKKNGVIMYNDEFFGFCGIFGITPNPCQNYRPRTKGKVERPFYYLQEHLLKGLNLNNIEEFETKLNEFTENYNNKIHPTFKDTPLKRFEKEKNYLFPVPEINTTSIFKKEYRKVSNDGYISWNASYYPVSMKYCLKDVFIEAIYGRQIKIYNSSGELLQIFQTNLFEKGIKPKHPEHEIINQQYINKKESLRSQSINRFIEMFDDTGLLFIENLKKTQYNNLLWHLSEIIEYTKIYHPDDVKKALYESITEF
ncbi:MAG: IS21 family transposase [Cyanobacteriota bacterium]